MNQEIVKTIWQDFGIAESEILNIYRYGSHVYGNATKESDEDFVVVLKSLRLPDGSFKSNAKSNANKSIQCIFYSRSGFLHGIDSFDIAALECLFLPSEHVILERVKFSIRKWCEKTLIGSIIEKAASSDYIAREQVKYGQLDRAAKGFYHALRILLFGIQLRCEKKIVNYSVANDMKFQFLNAAENNTLNQYVIASLRNWMVETFKNIRK